MSLLPVEPAWRLAERKDEHRWLIAGLWSEQAVGIVGGEPKCCKSFLALDIAVAVAAGIPCLRRFAVPRTGRVLLYAAEDALHIVRRRFDGICEAAGVALADLDIQVITAPTLRLDLEADRNSLAETVARLQPRLLILDPFVRCTASTRTPQARSRRCSPFCVSCSVDMASPCSSSIMPGKAPATPAPGRPCVALPSSTHGAIPTFICAVMVMT
jgi:hypothetical protein